MKANGRCQGGQGREISRSGDQHKQAGAPIPLGCWPHPPRDATLGIDLGDLRTAVTVTANPQIAIIDADKVLGFHIRGYWNREEFGAIFASEPEGEHREVAGSMSRGKACTGLCTLREQEATGATETQTGRFHSVQPGTDLSVGSFHPGAHWEGPGGGELGRGEAATSPRHRG